MIEGKQRTARRERLKREIMDYVGDNPDCTASMIAGALAVDRRMRNHGLTARKVGFFIPRFCKDIRYRIDSGSGCRIYSMAED